MIEYIQISRLSLFERTCTEAIFVEIFAEAGIHLYDEFQGYGSILKFWSYLDEAYRLAFIEYFNSWQLKPQ